MFFTYQTKLQTRHFNISQLKMQDHLLRYSEVLWDGSGLG